MIIRDRQFDTERHTYIMGILNTTPDSFSDGGKYNNLDAALRRAEEMIQEGADILDIGGESTRPGHTQITDDEEISRTAPIIAAIRKRFDIPLSIDTYKASVAQCALEAGADLVNDIWGLQYDPKMAETIQKFHVSCCLMHNRKKPDYQDFFPDFLDDLRACIRTAKDAGIPDDRILLDPGVGFGKTYEMNLAVIRNLDCMKTLGYPVLLGTSRKSVIGLTLDLPTSQRDEATLATTVYGMLKGCSFVRVHNVQANVRAVKMAEAIRDCTL